MEEHCSANSLQRILRFFKNQSTDASVSDAGNQLPSPTRLRRNLSEFYGFIGSISVVVATVISIIWAYVPDYWLQFVGIFHYLSRYWALAVPGYVMVTIVLAIGFYIGMNFMSTPPPTSLKSMFDEYSNEALSVLLTGNEDEEIIEPISDISIY